MLFRTDTSLGAGNCSSTSLGPGQNQLATTRPLFANVSESDFMTYVVPDTAHGINFRMSDSRSVS